MSALMIVGSAICVGVGAVTGAVVLNSVLIGLGLGVVSGWVFCGAAMVYCMMTPDRNAGHAARHQSGPVYAS